MTDIYFVVAFSGLLLLMVLGVCFAILARFGIVHLRTLQIVIAAAALILIIDVVVASIRARSDRRTSLTVDAIEHRGWWELRYGSVITANELHLPVGTPVLVRFAFLSRSILTFDGLDPVRNRFAGRFANVVITAPRKDEFFARRLSIRGSQRLMIVAEEAFDWLDGPVTRIAGPEVPAVPYNHVLEDWFMVNPDKILEGIRTLSAY